MAAVASALYARELASEASRANDLLDAQVQDQLSSSRLDRAAELSAHADDATPLISEAGEASAFIRVDIENVGRSAATQCVAWLETAPAGSDEAGGRVGNEVELGAIGPGTSARMMGQYRVRSGGVKRDGIIVARWTDGNGDIDRRVIGSIVLLL